MAKEGYLQRDEGLQPEDGTEDGSVVVEQANVSRCKIVRRVIRKSDDL
jgi:hypothetical protein